MLIIQCDVEGCEEKTELPSSNGFRGRRLPDGWFQIIKIEKSEVDPMMEKIVKRRPAQDPMAMMMDPSGGRARAYSVCPNHPMPKCRELPAEELDDFIMMP